MTQAATNVLLMASSLRGGGSEKQVLLLARHLDRRRFRPHLYLTEAAGPLMQHVPADVPVIAYDHQPAANTSPPDGWRIPGWQLRRQTRFVRDVIRRHAIDVVYDRTFHMTLLAGRAARGVRRVATIVSPPHLAVPFVEHRFVALKRRRLAVAYRGADAVVAVSRAAADSAEAYYCLPAGSVIVIPNPLDPDSLNPLGESGRTIGDEPASTSTSTSTSTTMVCVARMTAEKGHAELIEALPTVRDRWPSSRPPWQLRLVGDGPLRETLQSRVDALGLSDRVRFVGAVASAGAEIAAADALVLPSRFEGMPNVVLEAMALGTPVVATRSGGTAELQADQPTAFWAAPGDPQSLAKAILRFAGDPDQAARNRDAAQRYVRTHHDLGTIVGRIEAVLRP
jgi:glycosyltransferase involved in cell wall biosynthesis